MLSSKTESAKSVTLYASILTLQFKKAKHILTTNPLLASLVVNNNNPLDIIYLASSPSNFNTILTVFKVDKAKFEIELIELLDTTLATLRANKQSTRISQTKTTNEFRDFYAHEFLHIFLLKGVEFESPCLNRVRETLLRFGDFLVSPETKSFATKECVTTFLSEKSNSFFNAEHIVPIYNMCIKTKDGTEIDMAKIVMLLDTRNNLNSLTASEQASYSLF